jgi:hypothetical protein
MKSLILVLLALIVLAAPLHAQTPVTASSKVSFTDADATAVAADGVTALISYYEVRFTPTAGCAIVAPLQIGKPSADATGTITAPVSTFGTLPANCVYTAVLAAVGPGGEGVSAPSSPFVRVVLRAPVAPSKPAVLP